MDRDDVIFFAGSIFGMVIFISILLAGVNYISKLSCYAKTEGMNVGVYYSFLGGCRIETNDGEVVPLSAYRVLAEDL